MRAYPATGAFSPGVILATLLLCGCGRVSYEPLDRTDGGRGRDASAADAEAIPDARAPHDAPPPGDAPTEPDAASPLDATSCDDAHGGALFCDGYEDPSLAAWDYSVTRSGFATHTTEMVYRGSGALRCETLAGASDKEARYSVRPLPDLRTGHVWFRAYYHLSSTVVLDGHVSLLAIAERQRPYDGAHLRVDADSMDLAMEVAGVVGSGAVTLPRDRWVCIEYHVVLDEVNGVLEAYVDGALVARAEAVDTVPDTGISTAEVGIHKASADQSPAVLHVDEVVLDDTRVGCD